MGSEERPLQSLVSRLDEGVVDAAPGTTPTTLFLAFPGLVHSRAFTSPTLFLAFQSLVHSRALTYPVLGLGVPRPFAGVHLPCSWRSPAASIRGRSGFLVPPPARSPGRRGYSTTTLGEAEQDAP